MRPLPGARVARLGQPHVPAKRYLAAIAPGRPLSPQSELTLGRQGGAMTPGEAAAFARDPPAPAAVTPREADDAGKTGGLDAGVMEDWRPVLELVAAAHGSGG
ncbi:hypothetical protein GCM10009730_00320 [Streptomyces albidochromogenes]|uniref:hypothetical protein n=1 Tax=Streptomyces albidochromogenes TaxID=329524 RepID=UPI001FCB2553|nr:hypothetical protein [Streptomyces albidochromogenes]